MIARWVQARADVCHVVGGVSSWHLLRALGRRPLLFTVGLSGETLEPALYEKVTVFVAETRELAARLVSGGVDSGRIRVMYPGVDLQQFQPSPLPPRSPFRLLFASSPTGPEELKPRGVDLMVELARACPDVEMVTLWRRWGDLEGSLRALAALDPPDNFKVIKRDEADMARVFAGVHASVCFFSPGFGKSCPSSIIEGLATGRPALLSDSVGIASLLEEEKAGCVGSRNIEALLAALERLRSGLDLYSETARRVAERHFDQGRLLPSYGRLYRDLASRR